MELLCPECRSPLVMVDEHRAKCAAHAATFVVLFARYPVPAAVAPKCAPVASPPPTSTAARPDNERVAQCPACGQRYRLLASQLGPQARCTCGATLNVEATDMPAPTTTSCRNHRDVSATYVCARCQAAICTTCVFPQADGSTLCPDCVQTAPLAPGGRVMIAGPATPSPLPDGSKCRLHPAEAAVARCRTCSAPICPTCDFAFPGGVHLCPSCATAPRAKLSGARKARVAWALGLAIWSTVGVAVMLSGAFASVADTEELGLAVGLLVGIPTLIGGGLGVACLDRNLGNPTIVWVAAIWNGLLLAGWVLLCVIGSFMGG